MTLAERVDTCKVSVCGEVEVTECVSCCFKEREKWRKREIDVFKLYKEYNLFCLKNDSP